MGSRGPVPKRTEERRRRNKPEQPVTTGSGATEVTVPAPNPDWHPIALGWYRSLISSGQSRWYEPSDWWTAVYLAEAMSANLTDGGRMSAQMFASVMSGMTELLTTEGARRRARIELQRAVPAVDAGVAALDDYRKRLGG